MLAIGRDDFIINIIDIDTRNVVRKFSGHTNKITDLVGIVLSLLKFINLVLTLSLLANSFCYNVFIFL